MHLPATSQSLLPEILTKSGPLPATHARDGERFEPGRIYVAPPDRHMLLRDGTIRLSDGPRENWTRPAIDPLFRSAAIVYGPAAVGVVLTGQLDDGTAGLLAVKDRGGVAIVQDPESSTRIRLANDPWPDAAANTEEILRLENEIAEGTMRVDDWRDLERLITPTGFSCPDCGSVLYDLNDRRMLRFRCRSGHAFSPETAIAANDDRRQCAESSMFAALVEDATLARCIAGRPECAGDLALSTFLTERAARLERQADAMLEWRRETRTAEKEEALALV